MRVPWLENLNQNTGHVLASVSQITGSRLITLELFRAALFAFALLASQCDIGGGAFEQRGRERHGCRGDDQFDQDDYRHGCRILEPVQPSGGQREHDQGQDDDGLDQRRNLEPVVHQHVPVRRPDGGGGQRHRGGHQQDAQHDAQIAKIREKVRVAVLIYTGHRLIQAKNRARTGA